MKVAVTVERAARPYEKSGIQNLFYMSKETVRRLSALAEKNRVKREEDCWLERRPLSQVFRRGNWIFWSRSCTAIPGIPGRRSRRMCFCTGR